MWVISGPFDAAEPHDTAHFSKSKLLKPGQTYNISRKYKNENTILINCKKVSASHADLVLSEHTLENVDNPDAVPTLTFHNHRDKLISLQREDVNVCVNARSSQVLQSGDRVDVVVNIPIRVEWHPLCVYAPIDINLSSEGISLDDCASLGITLIRTTSNISPGKITHHLTSSLSPTMQLVSSLVHARTLVTPSWLKQFLHLGALPHSKPGSKTDPNSPQNLTDRFSTPSPSFYRPSPVVDTLPHPWPQADRTSLLTPYSFTLISSKTLSLTEHKALYGIIEMVGGTPTTFDVARVSKDREAWNGHLATALRKAGDKIRDSGQDLKGAKGLYIIVDEDAIKQIIGSETWAKIYVAGMKSAKLIHISPGLVLEAIIKNDASIVTGVIPTATSSPPASPKAPITSKERIPSSAAQGPNVIAAMEEEPQPTRSTLIRRSSRMTRRAGSATPEPTIAEASGSKAAVPMVSTSRASRQTPDPEPEKVAEASVSRKPLKRRTKTATSHVGVLLGLDYSVDDLQSQDVMEKPPPPALSSDNEEQPIGRLRLKRRVGQTQTQTLMVVDEEPENKPTRPSKRLRSLFERADPDRQPSLEASDMEPGSSQLGLSQTQVAPLPPPPGDQPANPRLEPVLEIAEDEDIAPQPQPTAVGQKRKRLAENDMILDLDSNPNDDPAAPSGATVPPKTPRKKRAVDGVNAVPRISKTTTIAKPPSSSRPERAQSPDRDESFLKALSSLKAHKSKNAAEEAFDRDFNALRISKPVHSNARDEEGDRDWALIDDITLDYGIRGNFMRVVEFEVHPDRQTRGRSRLDGEGEQYLWDQKPNFKKFRKSLIPSKRSKPKVELVLNEEPDYGVGSVYWPKHSQSHSQGISEQGSLSFAPPPFRKSRQNKTQSQSPVAEDSDQDMLPPPNPKTKQKAKESHPLFLDGTPSEHGDEPPGTLASTPAVSSPRKKRTTKPKMKEVLEDSEDDDMAFGGFGKGKKKSRR